MSSEITNEMRGRAYVICRDYLHGAWKTIGSEDMVIKHISGGLSNHLYYCALPSTTSSVAYEPSEVLVRFYGQVHGEGALENLLAESVIFTLLSERGLGPRLYGVFPGGRLEQYIPARSLITAELPVPAISQQIAIRMAKMHALNVPISKEPTWMWNCMKRWLKSSNEFLRTSTPAPPPAPTPSPTPSPITAPTTKLSRSAMLERLRSFNYEDEISYIRRLVTRIQSPVVFAHNDMQEGNILINNSVPRMCDRISLIDFEYCSYNYRGFDLANHFCEWTYSYTLPEEPYFTYEQSAFPTRDQQLNFIRTYLFAYEAACGRKAHPLPLENDSVTSSGKPPSIDNRTAKSASKGGALPHSITLGGEKTELVENGDTTPMVSHPVEEKLLQEVQVFGLASHLFWSLWSIVQGHVSKIPFGYLEFALLRMDHYLEDKRLLKSEDITKRKSDQISSKD